MSLTIDRIDWHDELALLMVDRLSVEGEELGGRALLEAANRRVPYRSGELEASAAIERGEGEVVVGYRAVYAGVLNRHPDWHYEGGRSGTWLEDAMESDGAVVGAVIEETFRSGWGG